MDGVMISRPPALAALADAYGPLFDRAAAMFAADDRVRGMWVHGSLARGAADAAADLDLVLAVRDADFGEFAGQWRAWLAAITPTLTAHPLGEGSFYALTATCERLDVIAEPVSGLAGTALTRRILVFDKDDLSRMIPPPSDPPPDAGAISYLIAETLRQAANFPIVVLRDDWLMGVVAVQQVQLFLYQLFAEASKPLPPTGPKQWSFKLTPYQRQVLESLPVAAPSQQSVRASREATFAAFFRDAPPIAERNGVPWPSQLETAVRAYLEAQGLPLPPPAEFIPGAPGAT
jgi:hypothetical protein